MDCCDRHGGKSHPGRAGHPRFKTGINSKYMPKGIRKPYEEALADPELLNLQDDLAILEALKKEQLQRLGTHEAGSLWRDLSRAWQDFRAADAAEPRDTSRVEAARQEFERLLKSGQAFERQRSELADTIERKGRVARAEWARMIYCLLFSWGKRTLLSGK
jgi:hypothetical protein